MTILCCDTSTDIAVLALADGQGELLGSLCLRHERQLSVQLYSALESLLTQSGCDFEQIGGLAVGLGPGSFTGVRVAVSTMRTLAQVTQKPLVGVGTLDIYAHSLAGPVSTRIAPLLPSRHGEAYAAVYDGKSRVVREPFAATYEALAILLAQIAPPGEIVLCGAVADLPESLSHYDKIGIDAPPVQAFAQLAAEAMAAGRFADPLGLNPIYAAAPAISQHKHK